MGSVITSFIRDNQAIFLWLGSGSIAVSVSAIILLPWMIINIPDDYFLHNIRKKKTEHPIIQIIFLLFHLGVQLMWKCETKLMLL